jgi:hypothetical protein
MATKKAAKKKPVKKKKAGPSFEDPPVVVGGGSSIVVKIPAGTTKTTVGIYDVYTVPGDCRTILKKNSKNGPKGKSHPTDQGYVVEFFKTNF